MPDPDTVHFDKACHGFLPYGYQGEGGIQLADTFFPRLSIFFLGSEIFATAAEPSTVNIPSNEF